MICKTAFIIIIAVISIAFLSVPVLAVEPNWTLNGTQWEASDGVYNIIKWNTTGNYNWTPASNVTITYLVIAGGGGGGSWNGGGGGAGGLLTGTLNVSDNVNVSIGAGGVGQYGNRLRGGNGGNSSFSSIIAIGGGGGGSYNLTSKDWINGSDGGSGGGQSYPETVPPQHPGYGTVGQGYDGGWGYLTNGYAGGGGGSGHVGGNSSNGYGGNGGNGTQNNITGNNTWYAGGGGGCVAYGGTQGIGGIGGGGNGCDGTAWNSTKGVNETGGGGGGGYDTGAGDGQPGGSGVVIIRVFNSTFAINASFTANTTGGQDPISVQFNDTSTNTPIAWNWSYKNVVGNNTEIWFSTIQNATVVFGTGNWSIKLYASNTDSSNISSQITYINVSAPTPPTASFDVNTTGGVDPISAQFNDTSIGSPTSWSWETKQIPPGNDTWFQFSTIQNATHVFNIGNWSIRLNATNSGGNNLSSQTTWINVTTNVTLPIVDFIALPMNGTNPLNVYFTDISTQSPTGWEWNFGDGSANETTRNTTHLYTTNGLFSPSLTVTNIIGNNYTIKIDYINVTTSNVTIGNTTNSTLIDLGGNPKLVQFRLQDMWGSPISNAYVTIQGITTTSGTWDWVITFLNLPLNEAPIENTLLVGTTDNYGAIEFMMVPTTKYNVTATLAGYAFPSLYIYPHDNEYTIVANDVSGQGWINANATIGTTKILNVTTSQISDTVGFVNVSYIDPTATTTGGYINITQGNVTLVSHHIVSNNFWVNQTVTIPMGGTSITVDSRVITTGGNFNRTGTFTFKGAPVTIPGLDSNLVMWGALFLIILTGLIASSTSAPMVSIIVCVESWVFYTIGWLNPLALKVGDAKLITTLSLATLLAVIWNVRIGKLKETGR